MKREIKLGKLLGLAVLGLGLLLGIGGKAEAASSANTSLRVTVSVSLDVSIGSSTYDFGSSLAANQTAISTGGIPVTNTSLGLTEDYQIYGSSSANWSPGVSTNTATDTFNLRVLISTVGTVAPAYGDFATTNTGLLDGAGNAVNMTNGNVGLFANGHGDNVPAGTSKYLWFRLITPANIATGSGVQQAITVTVVAASSSLF